MESPSIIKYIPLQQGLRPINIVIKILFLLIIKYIPLQQGLRHCSTPRYNKNNKLLSIFHYNKD